jgi:hypothetical protein
MKTAAFVTHFAEQMLAAAAGAAGIVNVNVMILSIHGLLDERFRYLEATCTK